MGIVTLDVISERCPGLFSYAHETLGPEAMKSNPKAMKPGGLNLKEPYRALKSLKSKPHLRALRNLPCQGLKKRNHSKKP